MIGDTETFGNGPVLKSTLPTMVVVLSLANALTTAALLVGFLGQLDAGDTCERRLVGEHLVPIGAAGQIVAETAERLDIRRKQAGLGDLRDLDHPRVALLSGLAPERGEVRRDRERIEYLAMLAFEQGDLRRIVGGAVL